jgi:ligand-binding sensor domain-containing protein/signal transduction histidine kinase
MGTKTGKMRISIFIFILLLISVLGICQTPTYYLDPQKNLSQYNFNHWTTENGLPSNSLLHIFQTSDGYLWISGYSGLIRFDGDKFTIYNTTNTDVFESNVIRNLAEDSKGNLWMTTQGSGLVSFKKGKFTAFGKEKNMMHLYRALLVDNKDRVWSAAPGHGWFYLENGIFHFLDYPKSLSNVEVRSIAQSPNGAIWFATLGEGLFKYENGILRSVKLPEELNKEWIYSLLAENDSKIWIGTSSGLYYYDGKNTQHVLPEIKCTVNDILKDHFGNLWIATINGLYRKNITSDKLECLTTENGLTNNFIIDFLFDFEGNFWMTQYKGGLTRIRDGKFTNYTYSGGLPEKVVNTICEIDSSSYLVGFDNGSLIKIKNGNILPFTVKNDLSGDRIRHIMIDSEKNTWISTYSGLLKIQPDGKEILYSEEKGFLSSKIRLTYEDSRGNIWIGTRNNGVIRIEPNKKIKVFDVACGLNSNLIMTIKEDRKGNIWIGTSEGVGGLNMITPADEIQKFTSVDGFKSDIVFNIYIDKEGLIWIATNNGLWLSRQNQYFCFTSKNGLMDNSPYDVVEDDYGFLWLPYSEGIMKVSKKEMIEYSENKIAKINCTLFNKYDGMKQSECNPTAQVLKCKNGKLFFPTLDGIALIDPLNVMYNNYIPPVVIEKLKIDNRFADLSTETTFKPGIKRYTFYYTALCLYEAEKVKFRYRLEGFESEWNETDNIRSVSYTNLPHGKYKFQVTACNNDQIWNEKGTEYPFTIKPSFTETFWFYLIFAIIFITITYIFYRFRISQLETQKKDLEEIIQNRTREILEKNEKLEFQKNEIEQKSNFLLIQKNEIEEQARLLELQKEELKEMNASKDKIFSIISHDLRSPLGNIKNMIDLLTVQPERFDEEKRGKIFENFSEITKSTFYLIDNLLNWTRSQRGLIVYDPQIFLVTPIIFEVLSLLKPMYDKKKISIINNIDESTLAYGDINMVKTIFRNLISNAVKFTGINGEIEISAKNEGETIEFAIRDNGIGISEDNLKNLLENKEINTSYGTGRETGSGLGLILCRDFIMKNGGSFRVESKLNEGSTFYFTLKRFQV